MGERADAAAKLHRVLRRLQNGFNSCAIDALACEGAVEIDHMQPFKALILKGFCLRGGIFVVDGRLIHVAELEAHALTVFQIDGGKKDHDFKASISGNWQ